MAALADPLGPPSKLDAIREHELYRYYHPLNSPGVTPPEAERNAFPGRNTLSANAASSPDTTLTAIAQLCALRLQASRAMISVIDREKQYFIAESTKTLDLVDNQKCEMDGDGLWIGCSTVEKEGRLCEKTIELPPALGCSPCYIVTDLSAHPEFCQLPFVTGDPYFKFYAGTPLTTKKGINIGSLFILDDVVRPPLTLDQEIFLGEMARVVMKHMELARESEERKKVMRLSMGMNAFVEGKHRLVFDNDQHRVSAVEYRRWSSVDRHRKGSGISRTSKTPSMKTRGSGSNSDPLRRPEYTGSPEPVADSESSQDDSDAGLAARSIDSGHHSTFARAANLLCESLDLVNRGGVVFFDSTSRPGTQGTRNPATRSRPESIDLKPYKPAEVISSSAVNAGMDLGNRAAEHGSFIPLDEGLLHEFLAKYPRGKMWTFSTDGTLSSSEEEGLSPKERRRSERTEEARATRKQMETAVLQRHFPGVRQLIFTGLWDAGSSRWFTGGFCWTTSSRHIFSVDTELSFFIAFGNSVMAEISRLLSMAADRQKSDFIGSISHEFRSPLHGILASTEFLCDTENLDAFQSSLIDTISSCGRTLLSTINHILDYSKINSFERNWRTVRKPGRQSRSLTGRRVAADKDSPTLNIYATTDVATVTEEVIEGVYAGQVYQDISSTEPTDFSSGAKVDTLARGIHIGNQPRKKKFGAAKEVEVILDIAHEDYIFVTQPGALKRVIMNVFGNALKYTQKGFILINLALDPIEGTGVTSANERMLQIKITDTGKGISREYLRTSLFNPFCQEDVLASGTGLGLSIVKSIITMLNGSIDVESEVGVGTEVTIRIPLTRYSGTDSHLSTPSGSTATESSGDDSMECLRAEYTDSIVALYGFATVESKTSTTGRVLKECIEDWYGLSAVLVTSDPGSADLILVDEKELPDLLDRTVRDIPIAVLCSNSTRYQSASYKNTPTIMEFVPKPFGPHKLAKALQVCLGKAKALNCDLSIPSLFPGESHGSVASKADTAIPGMETLTLGNNDEETPLVVQTNGTVTASESNNAQLAIDSSSSDATSGEITVTDGEDFPFPVQATSQSDNQQSKEDRIYSPQDRPVGDLTREDSRRPQLVSRMTEPLTRVSFPPSAAVTKQGEMATVLFYTPPSDMATAKVDLLNGYTPVSLTVSNITLRDGEPPAAKPPEEEKHPPRLLLVDDNKINLRLLETYMKKRKYVFVDSAENGQLAVDAASAQEHGYDIIFMDISMPVMNGFQATRTIRDIEEARSHNKTDGKHSKPALIIALTGLASSRDQTEAFTSGVDLFMTKPVSFKEVGRLLDNWESHGGLKPPEY